MSVFSNKPQKLIIVRSETDDLYFTVYCGILVFLYLAFPGYLDHAIRSITPMLKDVFEL